MKKIRLLISIALLSLTTAASASKLVSVSIVDKDYIMLYFRDGDVTFNERALSGWNLYDNVGFNGDINTLVTYGNLTTANVATANNWKITSTDDSNIGTTGVSPSNVYRKSKLGCMAQKAWNTSTNDWNYEWAYEHTIFLRLPAGKSMVSGKNYTIQIPGNINSDVPTKTITFDIFNSRSEAVKVNIVGYSTANNIKSADVYLWMGDGGKRDYSTFVGKKVYIYNIDTKTSQQVGTLSLWRGAAAEMDVAHQLLQTDVWIADFTGFNTNGNYRLAIEDIGCSDDFKINSDIYFQPFKVSTQGFYYMRIGENSQTSGITPVARRPLYIPGSSPANCTVYITTMHPYHANWGNISRDQWDNPTQWASYRKSGNPTNPKAYGGHSDAMDWDRHLGHVSIIYDILLPYYITKGKLSDDNLGIAESGNGIPDILDEARNEVDFWLRLRDGKGYSHGLTCPTSANVFYQAGNTGVAAWANAANAAMLASCFRISGHANLETAYRDSAINAYNYAKSLSTTDQMLNRSQGVGNATMTGNDFKITAAAFLYDVTGLKVYEDDLLAGSRCTSNSSQVFNGASCEIYAVAGYLFTDRTKTNTTRYNNMKSSIVAEAKTKEANYTLATNNNRRPSRRSTNQDDGWFSTSIHNQRTIIAHAVSDAGSADKKLFEDALVLEADYSLGRNPLNMINMTTASTALANKKSVENAYTSGWNDGTPGVHPGHTPYMNPFDWSGLIMGRPKWMTDKNFPAFAFAPGDNTKIAAGNWPLGELYYNTRYVYAANEFTPQQSMRGKQALYGYLYAIRPPASCSQYTVTFNSDGGSTVPPQTDCSGFVAFEPATPTQAGYSFTGWYNDATLYNFTTPVTGNVTLTAHWTPLLITSTVVADCETTETNTCTGWWDYDDGNGSKTICQKDGYILMTQGEAAVGNGYISVGISIPANGGNWSIWGVGFGFDLNPDAVPANLTGATGLSFYHKGLAGSVVIEAQGVGYSAEVVEHANWTPVTVLFSDMKSGVNLASNNLSSVKAIQFSVTASETVAKTGTFDIDHVQINNINLPLCGAAAPCTEYTVTFDSNDGSEVASQRICSGEKAVKPAANPTRPGYTFDNWYTALTGGSVFNFATVSITAATTVYARWIANTYIVTLDREDGTGGSTSVTATYDATMPAATAPTRTGYTFGGYYIGTNGTGTQYYNAAMESVRTWDIDATPVPALYASWTAVTVTVTLDEQNGTGEAESVTAIYGAAMPEATAPERTGYTFGGYYSTVNGGGTQYYTAEMESAKDWDLTVNTTLYARWIASTYIVTLDMQSGTGGSASVTATYGAAMPAATAPTKTGYTFGGYFTGTNGTGTQYYNATMGSVRAWDLASATTLNAQWTTTSYNITYNVNGGTAITNGTYTVESAAITLPATSTKNGFTFAGWYDNVNLTGNEVTSIPTGSTGDKQYYAKWTAVSYSITYNVNGGTAITNGTYTIESAAVTLPTTSTKNGYTFAGWYDNVNLTGNEVTSIPTGNTGDKQYYAKWTETSYTITYNVNGGTAITNGTYTIESAIVTLPATSTKNGYTFAGWYDNVNLTGNEVTTISTGSTGDKQFYAKWNIVTYTITYNTNGGSSVPDGSYTVEDGEITLPETTLNELIFAGWYENSNLTGNAVTSIAAGSTGNKQFYAKWSTVASYTITYYVNGGIDVPNGLYTSEDNEITLPATTRNGYTFAGWYDNVNLTGNEVTSIPTGSTGNKQYYAGWTAVSYSITYNTNGGTVITNGTYTIESAAVTLPTTSTKNGYTFAGWYDNVNLTGNEVTTIPTGSTGDKQYYAKWTAVSYSITYNVNDGTVITNGTYTIESAAVILPTTSTKNGYTFAGWYDNVNLTGNEVTTIPTGNTGDKQFYAKWTATSYTITYNVNGGSTILSGTYTIESAAVTLPATSTKNGYTFAGWYDNANLTGSEVTTIPTGSTGDKQFYAKWNIVTYTITYNTNGGSSVPDGSYTVEDGEITLPETTLNGFIFAGWYENPNFTENAVTGIAAGSTGNKQFYAKWSTVASYTITYYANGGIDVPNGLYTSEDNEIILPATTRNGYTFAGWYDNVNLTGNAVTSIPTGSTGDKQYYAKWTAGTYTVTLADGQSVTATYGEAMPAATAPTKTGYTFGGYYSEPNGAGTQYYTAAMTSARTWNLAGNTTLYASWTAISYPITYILDGGDNALENPLTYTIENYVILQNPTKDGYKFDRWEEGGEIPAGSTGEKTFTAVWSFTDNIPDVTSSIAALQIYPNPANDGNFNVTLSNSVTATLTIINLQGQAVYNTVINNGFASINSGLETGVYIVSVQSESGLKTQKLIIKQNNSFNPQ